MISQGVAGRCIVQSLLLLALAVLTANQASGQFGFIEESPTPLIRFSDPDIVSQPLGDPYGVYDARASDPYQSVPGFATNSRPLLWNRIVSDHKKYYDWRTFRLLTCGFLIAAPVANTKLDREIQDHFQTSVPGATSDDWSEFLHADKNLGDGLYTLPVYAAAWAAGELFDQSPLLVTTGRWGERTLRSFVVGVPPVMLAQRLTGGSRPSESARGSRWLPFQDDNGVSGHAFMGALPFFNAANITENRWLKGTFYAGSLLVPLSRLNDDDHYPSQVALGWWMAYVAAAAIDRTEMANGSLQIYPYVANDSYGGMLQLRY